MLLNLCFGLPPTLPIMGITLIGSKVPVWLLYYEVGYASYVDSSFT